MCEAVIYQRVSDTDYQTKDGQIHVCRCGITHHQPPTQREQWLSEKRLSWQNNYRNLDGQIAAPALEVEQEDYSFSTLIWKDLELSEAGFTDGYGSKVLDLEEVNA